MTTALFRWLPLVLAWFTVLYRAPGARRSRAALFVWLTTLTVAVAVTLDLPQTARALDAVPNLVHLIKYSLILAAATCVREALVHLPPTRRSHSPPRVPVLLAWTAAVAGMTAAWIVAPVHDRHVADHFTEVYATRSELVPLWTIYLGYLAFMLASLFRSQLGTYRALPSSPVRNGMLAVGFGAAIGLLYVTYKAAYLAVTLAVGAAEADTIHSSAMSTALLGASLLLLVGGGLWPAVARLLAWWDSVITYYALEPLWRLATAAVPEVVLADAGAQNLSQRAEGRVVEIRDALSSLPPPSDVTSLGASIEQRVAVALLERVAAVQERPDAAHQPNLSAADDDIAYLKQLSNSLVRVERSRASRLDRVARTLTDALAPAYLVALTVLIVACTAAGLLSGFLWSMLTLLFTPGIPVAVIAIGVRKHWWSDRHVRVRGQRLIPLSVALLSIIACLAVLSAAGAPSELSALVIAMTAGLSITLAVTFFWKVSVHSAVAAGSAVVLALQLDPGWGVLVAGFASAVGWSRWWLREHTLSQVLAGAALGAVVAAAVFGLLTT